MCSGKRVTKRAKSAHLSPILRENSAKYSVFAHTIAHVNVYRTMKVHALHAMHASGLRTPKMARVFRDLRGFERQEVATWRPT
jgi:hypothetical protein